MKFHAAPKEDREEWRNIPLTRAAFLLLGEMLEDAARSVQSAAESGDEREVRLAAGVARGLKRALDVLSEG